MASDGYRRGYVSFAHFLLYFSLFWRPFSVTIATTKSKSILTQNTLIIQLIKQLKEKFAQSFFASEEGGGAKTGLNVSFSLRLSVRLSACMYVCLSSVRQRFVSALILEDL